MFKVKILFLILFLFLTNIGYSKDKTSIENIRTKEYVSYIRLVIELSQKEPYNAFTLKDPERIVVDINNTSNIVNKSEFKSGSIINSIRVGRFDLGARVVLDLNFEAKIRKQFLINPDENNKYYRLVVDIEKSKSTFIDNSSKIESKDLIADIIESIDDPIGDLISDIGVSQEDTTIPYKSKKKTKSIKFAEKEKDKFNIVVDAGHGGKDPGAIGARGTKEKFITLLYARELKKTLEATGKYNVFLTRQNDYFVKLHERVAMAKRFNGDLFISIHADSALNKSAKGLSVYTLSQKASDTRTAKLANKENKADILGGVNLYGEYQDTINILVDLSRQEAVNMSRRFADIFTRYVRLERIRTLSNKVHKQANFAVLLSPDMPSILVELGFISNKDDERMLKTYAYRNKMMKVILTSVNKYFDE